MKSLREALKFWKEVNDNKNVTNLTIKELSTRFLFMKFPNLISNIILRLNPEAVFVRPQSESETDAVHATGKLQIDSAGYWSWSGHVKNEGVLGKDFAFGGALTFKDPASGKNVAFEHTGTVHGSTPLDIGKDHDEFEKIGFDLTIADNWNVIKNTGANFTLHIVDNLGSALAELIEAFVGAGIIVGGVQWLSGSGQAECSGLTPVPDNKGGGGVETGWKFRHT